MRDRASNLTRRSHAAGPLPVQRLRAEPPTSPPPQPRARRLIDWQHLATWAQGQARVPSVGELAARVHLSAAQFSARCNQELGQSPMQWVRLQRLTQARAWLNSGQGVAQTAQCIGYHSASALTAALRREGI